MARGPEPVCGDEIIDCPQNASPVPGVYYLAIFGTDRVAFDDNGVALEMPIPPTVLDFPHAAGAGCTSGCDLRPVVPGRVNRPGPPLVGREPPDPNLPTGTPNGMFDPATDGESAEFVGLLADPVTSVSLTRGPVLGGIGFLDAFTLVTTDRNGPIVQCLDVPSDTVQGFELPREYVIDRLTIR